MGVTLDTELRKADNKSQVITCIDQKSYVVYLKADGMCDCESELSSSSPLSSSYWDNFSQLKQANGL